MKTKAELIAFLQKRADNSAFLEIKDDYLQCIQLLLSAGAGADPTVAEGGKSYAIMAMPTPGDTSTITIVHARLFTTRERVESFAVEKHNFALCKHPLYPVLLGYIEINPHFPPEKNHAEPKPH